MLSYAIEKWYRVRDSHPHGMKPAVSKTAVSAFHQPGMKVAEVGFAPTWAWRPAGFEAAVYAGSTTPRKMVAHAGAAPAPAR